MTIDSTQFPQLAKMEAAQEPSQAIGEFIEWLGQNGMAICASEDRLRGSEFFPVLISTEELLARYFNIDLKTVEKERRSILDIARQFS